MHDAVVKPGICLPAVERGRVGPQARQLGQGHIREEQLTNGGGRIYLIGRGHGKGHRSAGAGRLAVEAVEAAEAVEAVEWATQVTQNLVELPKRGQQLREIGSQQKEAHAHISNETTFPHRSRQLPSRRHSRPGTASSKSEGRWGGQVLHSSRNSWRGCTTDSRRSCQTPVFARSGAR